MQENEKNKANILVSVFAPYNIAQTRNLKRVFIIIGFLAVLIVITLVYFSTHNNVNAARKTSMDFIASVQNKDANQVQSLFAAETKQAVTKKEIEALFNQPGGYISGSPQLISNSAQDNSSSTRKIEYEFKGSDERAYKLTVTLIKEAGTWKILNINKTLR